MGGPVRRGVRQESSPWSSAYIFVALVYVYGIYYCPMNTKITPETILQQIALIQRMDRGTVSIIRQGAQGPYYNHQCYEEGRNVSRYVPAEQVPDLKAAIQDFRRFQELVDQYVNLVVEETRAERQAGLKKRPPTRAPPGPRPGNPTTDDPL